MPRGYDLLLGYFREDEQLRENFFSRLKFMFYAGAALSQPLWDAYRKTDDGHMRRARTDGHRPWRHRNFPDGPAMHLGFRARRRDRNSHARRGSQSRPDWRQNGDSGKGAERDARLLARPGADSAEPSTKRATTNSATRSGSSTRATSTRACSSTAVSPRISSCPPARSSTSARCATSIIHWFAPYVIDAVITGHDRNFLGMLLVSNLESVPRAGQGTAGRTLRRPTSCATMRCARNSRSCSSPSPRKPPATLIESSAPCCSKNHPPSTRVKSPTKARSISA